MKASVTDCWGQGTTGEVLGPDILNLVLDAESDDPWEDEDRLSFPAFDNKLTTAKVAGAASSTQKCFSGLGIFMS
jgi:hypothetical protein